MALIKCEECGKEISDKSKICVHCGNPIFENKIKNIKKKKWEDLTESEITSIVAYRKTINEWNIGDRASSPFMGFLMIVSAILFVFGMIKEKIILMIFFPPIAILVYISVRRVMPKQDKEWYEKNIDRLYIDKILK